MKVRYLVPVGVFVLLLGLAAEPITCRCRRAGGDVGGLRPSGGDVLRDGHVGADRWSILVRDEPAERVRLSDRHPPVGGPAAGPHALRRARPDAASWSSASSYA